MALIVILSVMNGFEDDIKTKILGTQSHLIISSYTGGISDPQQVLAEVKKDPDVKGATPFILSQGLISAPAGVRGAVIRGIDPLTAPDVIRIREIITEGSFDDLDTSGVLIGSELALHTGVSVGDSISIISVAGTITPLGMIPQSRAFIVKGLFTTGMYEYDSNMIYISLDSAQKLFKQDQPSGIELKLADIYQADTIGRRLVHSLGPGYWAKTWKDMNRSLFSALKLEKVVMFIILLFIILVAGFSIISTLIMLVMEKRRDIAILKSMGTTTSQVLRIFITMGMVIGISGTLLGLILGLVLANNLNPVVRAIEMLFGIEVMPMDVYYITGLPTQIIPHEVGMIVVASLILSFLATIYPARKAAKQDPVEVMRHEG